MSTSNITEHKISKENADQYTMLYPMLTGLLEEMRELSKKKQDGALNTLKAKTINRILEKAKRLVEKEPTSEFLEMLDEQTLPTNSDAVIMIVQFKSALDAFHIKYTRAEGGRRHWQYDK